MPMLPVPGTSWAPVWRRYRLGNPNVMGKFSIPKQTRGAEHPALLVFGQGCVPLLAWVCPCLPADPGLPLGVTGRAG